MASVINDYVAGAIGGAAGLMVGHPFDTIKVQLQTQQTSSPYKSTWDAVRSINKQGMAKGFFRGMAFPVASYGIVNSVFFGIYGNALNYFKAGEKRSSTNREVYVSGCIAGFAQLFVACPVDVVKVVLQSQIPHSGVQGPSVERQFFKGPIQCTRWHIKNEGIFSLFKGFGTMAYRDVPAFGFYALVYNSLHKFLHSMWGRWDKNAICANLIAGGMAGLVSWIPVIPFDNVKSIIQADSSKKYKGMVDCSLQLYQSRGIRGFFTGTLMISIRAFPVNAVTFLVYAKTLEFMNGCMEETVSIT